MNEVFTATAIIATRNRPEMLRRALRSVAAQRDAGLAEIVVVYDQSDPDMGLVGEFPEVPVRVITNTRTPGLAGARNSGILAATGTWIALCDDDDAWSADKLLRQREVIDARPDVDFVVGGITIAYGEKRIERRTDLVEITFEDLLRDRVMEAHPSTFLVRRAAIDGYLGFVDEELPGSYAEDYDWLLRAARTRTVSVADASIALIQWHTDSYFGNRWGMIDEALGFLLDKTPEFGQDPRGKARIVGQRAFAQAAMGQRSESTQTAREALRLDWREPRAYLSFVVASRLVGAERLVKWASDGRIRSAQPERPHHAGARWVAQSRRKRCRRSPGDGIVARGHLGARRRCRWRLLRNHGDVQHRGDRRDVRRRYRLASIHRSLPGSTGADRAEAASHGCASSGADRWRVGRGPGEQVLRTDQCLVGW